MATLDEYVYKMCMRECAKSLGDPADLDRQMVEAYIACVASCFERYYTKQL